MKSITYRILRNPISFEFMSLFVGAFYCLVYAVASIPSIMLIRWGIWLGVDNFLLFIFIVICFFAFYIFLITSSIFVGFVERLLSLGFKPGVYHPTSSVFFRWLIYSGLHLWTVNLVLPFLRGTNWLKMYLRICGAKIGKEVFLNTKDFYDAYLLEINDNVFIGGEAFINCHIFEGGHLVLGKIILGKGTAIGANAYLTPGTNTGKNSRIGMYTYLRRNTSLPDDGVLISMPGMSIRQIIKIMRDKL